MLTSPHAVAGATIGALLPNPWLALPLAVGSHFLFDSIPHWQETLAPYVPTRKTYIRIPFDLLLAVSLTALIASWHPQNVAVIWLCAGFANLPDADTLTILRPKLRKGLVAGFYDWHCRIQRETSSRWGIVTQALLISLCLIAARNL